MLLLLPASLSLALECFLRMRDPIGVDTMLVPFVAVDDREDLETLWSC
jgi:hypothetical protein